MGASSLGDVSRVQFYSRLDASELMETASAVFATLVGWTNRGILMLLEFLAWEFLMKLEAIKAAKLKLEQYRWPEYDISVALKPASNERGSAKFLTTRSPKAARERSA